MLAQFQLEQLITFQCSALQAVLAGEGAFFVSLSEEGLVVSSCPASQRRGVPEVARKLPASLRGAACKVIWDKRQPGVCEGLYHWVLLQAIHLSPFEPLLGPQQNGKPLCFLEESFLNVMAFFEALSKKYFYFVFCFSEIPSVCLTSYQTSHHGIMLSS